MKQPRDEAGYKYTLVDAIRVCGSIHEVRVRPEASFWEVSLSHSVTCYLKYVFNGRLHDVKFEWIVSLKHEEWAEGEVSWVMSWNTVEIEAWVLQLPLEHANGHAIVKKHCVCVCVCVCVCTHVGCRYAAYVCAMVHTCTQTFLNSWICYNCMQVMTMYLRILFSAPKYFRIPYPGNSWLHRVECLLFN